MATTTASSILMDHADRDWHGAWRGKLADLLHDLREGSTSGMPNMAASLVRDALHPHGHPAVHVVDIARSGETVSGKAGHDVFLVNSLAQHGDVIKGFTPGQDVLVFLDAPSHGHADTDPHLTLIKDGTGTDVVADAGTAAQHTIVTLENVLPGALHLGTDYFV